MGAHDVVGGGGDNGGGDISNGSWWLDIGGAPSLMLGMAVPAMVPAPGGVDDANNRSAAAGGEGGNDGDSRAAADWAGRWARMMG